MYLDGVEWTRLMWLGIRTGGVECCWEDAKGSSGSIKCVASQLGLPKKGLICMELAQRHLLREYHTFHLLPHRNIPKLVEAVGYKPKGHGFETRWGEIFLMLPAALDPGVHSTSNRNEALGYKSEGSGFETRWGEILNLPNPSGRTRPWGSLSL
jgi:hypothetical protein